MGRGKSREEISLVNVLIDGFEKNEIPDGFHWRDLPMPDEAAARRTFEAFVEEARCWKGPPIDEQREPKRQLARWSDLEVRQADRTG